MKAITFYNDSSLDMKAVKTFGLSAKEGDNPIGFFGTGLKYAIAICCREDVPLRIYTNGECYEFFKQERQFRNTTYEAIFMNGEELPFTTELGKTWELWAAFRELLCNAIDEGGQVTDREDLKAPTRIVIYGPKAAKLYAGRKDVYLDEEVDFYGRETEVLSKGSNFIYYRGIRVYRPEKPMSNTYNLTSDVDLTEDRSLAFSWQAEAMIERTIAESNDKDFIRKALKCGHDYYEHDLVWDHIINNRVSTEFLDVVKELYQDFSDAVNPNIRTVYKKLVKKDEMPVESVEITAVQAKMFQAAKDVARGLDLPVDKYPIIIVEDLGNGVKGLALNGTAYISKEVFEDGTKWVTAAVLEELIHLTTGYQDYSRALQSYLLFRLISLYEEKRGEPL